MMKPTSNPQNPAFNAQSEASLQRSTLDSQLLTPLISSGSSLNLAVNPDSCQLDWQSNGGGKGVQSLNLDLNGIGSNTPGLLSRTLRGISNWISNLRGDANSIAIQPNPSEIMLPASGGNIPQPLPPASGNLPQPLPPASGNLPQPLPPASGNIPQPLPPVSGNIPQPLPPVSGNIPQPLPPVSGNLPDAISPSTLPQPRALIPSIGQQMGQTDQPIAPPAQKPDPAPVQPGSDQPTNPAPGGTIDKPSSPDQPSKTPSEEPKPDNPSGAESGSYEPKVSREFLDKVKGIGQRLQIAPEYLMAVMGFETGGSYSPSVKNQAGSGATGLIQFMPDTANQLGTSTKQLAKMSAIQQLDYVEKYMSSYSGRLKSLEDVYMAVLYPKAIGKGSDSAMFTQGTTVYKQNAGLDINKDGKVTPAEATDKVRKFLPKSGIFNA